MNKREIRNKMKYYQKKKFFLSNEYFEEEKIIDRDIGYSEYETLEIQKCLGLPFKKKSRRKFISAIINPQDDQSITNVGGFDNGRQSK